MECVANARWVDLPFLLLVPPNSSHCSWGMKLQFRKFWKPCRVRAGRAEEVRWVLQLSQGVGKQQGCLHLQVRKKRTERKQRSAQAARGQGEVGDAPPLKSSTERAGGLALPAQPCKREGCLGGESWQSTAAEGDWGPGATGPNFPHLGRVKSFLGLVM